MVTVLCGPVAAGKTFLAERLGREGALVLSCDEMMLTLFDRCLGPEHHDEMAMRCLRYLFSVAVQEARMGRDVVVDYGMWLRQERDAARQAFRSAGVPYRILLVEVDEATRLRRLERRNEGLRNADHRVYLIEGELLERMDAKWRAPGPGGNRCGAFPQRCRAGLRAKIRMKKRRLSPCTGTRAAFSFGRLTRQAAGA